MSDWLALKRLTMLVISLASWPSTGVGKKNSMRVAASADVPIQPTPSATTASCKSRFISMAIPSPPGVLALDAGKHEAVDELTLERDERDQERQRDQQGAGRDQAPLLSCLGARREARETDRERAGLGRAGHHQGPQELVPVRGHRDDRE